MFFLLVNIEYETTIFNNLIYMIWLQNTFLLFSKVIEKVFYGSFFKTLTKLCFSLFLT